MGPISKKKRRRSLGFFLKAQLSKFKTRSPLSFTFFRAPHARIAHPTMPPKRAKSGLVAAVNAAQAITVAAAAAGTDPVVSYPPLGAAVDSTDNNTNTSQDAKAPKKPRQRKTKVPKVLKEKKKPRVPKGPKVAADKFKKTKVASPKKAKTKVKVRLG